MSTLKRAGNALTSQDQIDIRRDIGLGTAATVDAPASGDASSAQVVKGNDTRLTDARTPSGAAIVAATSKTTPVDADSLPISDSAASGGLKRVTWANVKATLKEYFDGIYQAVLVSGTSIKTINGTSLLGSGDITVSGGGATNLSYTASPTQGVVASDTGTDATVPLSDDTNAGLMAPAQHTKLAGIGPGANVASVAGKTGVVTLAAADVSGAVQIAGDLGGTAAAPVVAKINGVAVTGTPTVGQVPTATSGTAATWQTPSGGGSPGGSDTQVQFNDGGAFAGASGWTWNKTTNTMTLASGTQTTSNPAQVVTQTWNAAGVTMTGWRLNITDTASAAASLLADFQLGGASIVNITKSGIGTGLNRSLTIQAGGGGTSGDVAIVAGNGFAASSIRTAFVAIAASDGVRRVGLISNVGGIELCANGPISWSANANGPADTSKDAYLYRDGVANTLAQRNGANAQEHRTYGTFTDASNYRRFSKGMSTAGVAFLRPEGAGTGASGNVLHISGLPTSNPGPGILWNDAGTVKVGT